MKTLTELRREGKGQAVQRKRKTVSVSERTYNKLRELGRYGDSATDVIDRCIKSHEKLIANEGGAEPGAAEGVQ